MIPNSKAQKSGAMSANSTAAAPPSRRRADRRAGAASARMPLIVPYFSGLGPSRSPHDDVEGHRTYAYGAGLAGRLGGAGQTQQLALEERRERAIAGRDGERDDLAGGVDGQLQDELTGAGSHGRPVDGCEAGLHGGEQQLG